MNTNEPSLRRGISRRSAAVGVAAVVVIAAVLIGVSLSSSSPLPTLNASYKCVPGTLIPQLQPGQSGTLSASFGDFTATFHATVPAVTPYGGPNAGMPFKGSLTLTGGRQTWSLPRPTNTRETEINAMCVIAFQPEQHPGVMVEGFTGGAHCCEVPVIYVFNATKNRYVKVVDLSPTHPTRSYTFDHNGGFIPKIAGRQVLLATGDDRFSYAFGCYACSALPIVLYSVDSSGLTNVTSRHVALVVADAAAIWKTAATSLRAEGDSTVPAPFGFLSSWVADECSLGRGNAAWTTIDQLQSQGKLSDASYHSATMNPGSFTTSLRLFLLKDGYCTGQI